MILLDYLYYQICNFYKKFDYSKDISIECGFIILLGFILANIVFLCITIDYFFGYNFLKPNKYIMFVYLSPFLVFNSIRYWKYTSYEKIKGKVLEMNSAKTTMLDIFIIIYVIISLPVFLGFAIYVGNMKNQIY